MGSGFVAQGTDLFYGRVQAQWHKSETCAMAEKDL
jgi:hypothetical protein